MGSLRALPQEPSPGSRSTQSIRPAALISSRAEHKNAARRGSNEIARAIYTRARIDRRASNESNVEIRDREGVLLDELTTRLDLITHQRGEDVVGGECVFDLHLHEPAARGIDRRLPQLLGIHLAESFVALDGLAFARLI